MFKIEIVEKVTVYFPTTSVSDKLKLSTTTLHCPCLENLGPALNEQISELTEFWTLKNYVFLDLDLRRAFDTLCSDWVQGITMVIYDVPPDLECKGFADDRQFFSMKNVNIKVRSYFLKIIHSLVGRHFPLMFW